MKDASYELSYIMAGDGLAAIHIESTNSGEQLYYVHKDHLGSIQCLSCDNTSSNNGIVEEYSYDAWGKRTYPDEPGYNNDYSYADLCRGYTGHEHLPEFGLINMNGRLYDPLLGRFLSPDNYVQMPNFTQNFNRFGYCFNNPLIYTDPSGNVFVLDDLLIAVAIGAVMNTAMQGMSGNINSGGDFFKAMGIGALAGAAGYGAGLLASGGLTFTGSLGNAMANGAIVGATSGFAAGFVGGAGNAWTNGSSFGNGLKQGFIGGGMAALSGAVIGASVSGIKYLNTKKAFLLRMQDDGIKMNGKKVNYSNENAKKFSDKYFGDVEGLNKLYADGTEPPNGFNSATGVTEKLNGNKSNVYLKSSAFRNKFKLFNVMGHEYIHVAQNYAGLPGYQNFLEVGAYSWNKWVHTLLDRTMPTAWNDMYLQSLGNVAKNTGLWYKQGYTLPNMEDFMWYNLKTFSWKLIP